MSKVSKREIEWNQSRAIGAGLVHCPGCPAGSPRVDPDAHDRMCERHFYQSLHHAHHVDGLW